jgi:hypothetical protein
MKVHDVRSFDDLRDTGLLWAINRYIFHPRGLAMAVCLEHDEDSKVFAWRMMSLLGETFNYDEEADQSGFRKFTQFLQSLEVAHGNGETRDGT